MAKKAAKGSATKTEAITLRVNPKVKFGLELLARQQHRTLSSVLEWVINIAFQDEEVGLWRNRSKGLLLAAPSFLLDEVWDPIEADRLIKLALFKPSLLSYEEELLWKIIKESPDLWENETYNYKWVENMLDRAKQEGQDVFDEPVEKFKLFECAFLFWVLREAWADCEKYINGDINAATLNAKFNAVRTPPDLLSEDDIPF